MRWLSRAFLLTLAIAPGLMLAQGTTSPPRPTRPVRLVPPAPTSPIVLDTGGVRRVALARGRTGPRRPVGRRGRIGRPA